METTFAMSQAEVCVLSPAKINWNLRVLYRREDGFHEIESLVSAVTLYDELLFSGRADSAHVLYCDHPDVPGDERNLICRAADLLANASGRKLGFDCRLTKRIPIGGGMGGGSSNGAVALMALNRLWGLGWPFERLAPLAAELGSDVSFFLNGRTAVIRGRGERVEPVELGWRGFVVLLLPGFSVSTPAVYREWSRQQGASPAIEKVKEAGEVPAIGSAADWMRATFNMLEEPAMVVSPPLRAVFERATALADRPVRISGSGSSLFTAFDSESEAQAFAGMAQRDLNVRIVVVQPAE